MDETRDIVRMLRLCQQEAHDQYCFSEQILRKSRRQYSRQSWLEISAGLAAFLDPIEVGAIEKILVGFKRDFSLAEFRQRLDAQIALWPQVKQLCKNKTDAEIISIMYNNGVIGNLQHPGFRFVYRGDAEVQMDLGFRVHKALWSRFSLATSPRAGH